MEFKKTKLEGVYIIEPSIFEDDRGIFIKAYNDSIFENAGIELEFKESFYSISKRNVIRGMHFQLPPHDYAKLVYVTEGVIVDVVLDIRKNSPTYAEYISVQLSSRNARQIYMPQGFAHGFAVISNSATVTYLQTAIHSPEYDTGIRWDSFGMDWNLKNPIISERDRNFPKLEEFDSPFLYNKGQK